MNGNNRSAGIHDACGCVSRQEIYMYKPLRWKIIPLLFLLFVSCTSVKPTRVPVSTFADPDPELTTAVRQAQDTLYIFRNEFLDPKPSYEYMSVKVRFTNKDGTEDIWTNPIDVDGDVFVIQMLEGVTLELKAHPDRYLDVPADDIIDWMILDQNGTVFGGYTLRLDYERLSPEEQKHYRERTGYLRFE
jgi:uncharacterized protein YegJ (DUF2314 family)